MAHPLNIPVEVRGTIYPSVKAAADALGIRPASVSAYLSRNGHTNGLGLGARSPAHFNMGHCKAITIHGARFATIKDAARALGVRYTSLHRTLRTPMTPKKSDRLLRLVMEWRDREARRCAQKEAA